MNAPEFKSHDERDAYFKDHASYFTLVRKAGVGIYDRTEFKTLEDAQKAGQTKALIGGGGWMIYAVMADGQSALVGTIKTEGNK